MGRSTGEGQHSLGFRGIFVSPFLQEPPSWDSLPFFLPLSVASLCPVCKILPCRFCLQLSLLTLRPTNSNTSAVSELICSACL